MFTLIIDTTTERGIVAFSQGTILCFSQDLPVGSLSSKFLLGALQNGFKTLNITPRELGKVAVASGPGMFTGIRVGVATAQGIASGLKIPLLSFSSLLGFIHPEEGIFASAIDARVGGVYTQLQERKGDTITLLGPAQLLPISELKCERLVGPSFARLPFKGIETAPDATHLAKVVNGMESSDPFKMIYLREF